MDPENNEVTQTVEDVETNVEETGKVGTQANENKDEVETKTFTQEQVNAMLAKEKKKMPSKEELKAFKEWQESQKSAEQKQAEKETEYQSVLSKNESLIQENQVLKAGVNADDVDYVVFKVSKLEGEFEENLTEFLKSNPKFLGKATEEPKATGIPVKTIGSNDTGVKAILKAKHPELYKN